MFVDILRKLWEYISFRLNSKPKGGYRIHSPFVFELYTKVIDVKTRIGFFDVIDNVRRELKRSKDIIIRVDYGAGSNTTSKVLSVSDIARLSSTPKYLGELLYRLVEHYKPGNMLELGTSLGLSALYLASGNHGSNLYTIEGDKNLSAIAKEKATKIGLTNIHFINGEFSELLPEIVKEVKSVDFVYIDGDHGEDSTLMYFNMLKRKSNEKTIMVIDDIRWSDGMKNAWSKISSDIDVSISVDLFRCGLVFFRKGIVKQHFYLRFGPF